MSTTMNTDIEEYARLLLSRRYRRLRVSPQTLLGMCKQRGPITTEVIEGLPADAVVVESYYDMDVNAFEMVVVSDSFDTQSDDVTVYPEATVVFRRIYDDVQP